MRRIRYLPVAPAAAVVLLSASLSPASAASADAQVPSLSHVFLIVGENTQLSQLNAGNAPYMTAAMTGTQWASLTDYWATTHYSESNYVAMTSGQFTACQQKDGTAANCHQDVDNLFHQLFTAGKTFTTWSESMPNACHLLNTGGRAGLNHYAAKHNPQLFFDNVEGNAVTPVGANPSGWLDNGNTQGGTFCQATNISASVSGSTPNDMSVFDGALAGTAGSPAISDFNLVVPNECEDAHDNCSPAGNPITQFDNFLAQEVPKIQDYINHNGGLLLVTFDEGVTSSPVRAVKFENGGNVMFLAWGPQVHPAVYTANHNHYGLLRTLEDGYGVGYVANANNVPPISEIWNP